jgi:hypothetical protein
MDRGAKSMRDFAGSLRRELKLLEDQIAADPRLRKAQKIRELLAIYEEADDAAASDRSGGLPIRHAVLPALPVERTKTRGIRSAIQNFMRRADTATVARSRLVALAQSNHWPNASPAWLQLQTDASGRPLSYENVFAPGQIVTAAIPVPRMAPPANGHLSGEQEGSPAIVSATTPIGSVERRPAMDTPIGLVSQALKTA